jgi:hypothetical protein
MRPVVRLLVLAPLAGLIAISTAGTATAKRSPPASHQLPPPPAFTAKELVDRARDLIAPSLERGDAALASGRPDAALEEYLQARLLLLPGDVQGAIDVALRIGLAEATIGHCDQARRAIRSVQGESVLTSDPARADVRTRAYWTIDSLCRR